MSHTDDQSSPNDDSEQGQADLAETVQSRPVMPDGQPGLAAPSSSTDVGEQAAATFRSNELFEALTAQEVREVVDVCNQRSISAGAQLFGQGDQADALYIVETGELQVRARTPAGEDVMLAVLGAGTVVGEMSLIGGGPRSASVDVISDATVFELDRDSFDRLRTAQRPAAYKIILQLAHMLGQRRRQTDARVEEVFAEPDQYIDNFESQVHDMLGRFKKA